MDHRPGPILSSPLVTRAARWGIVAWAAIGVAVLGVVIYRYVLWPVRIIFPPLVLALIFVYLLNPIVSMQERRGVPRLLATFITYVVFLSILGVGMAYLIPVVSDQVTGFVRSVPDLLDRTQDWVRDLSDRLGVDIGQEEGAFSLLQENLQGGSLVGRLTSFTAGVLHVALIVVLGPILAFYLLVDLPKIRQGIRALIPARRRDEADALGDKLSAAVGGFFRGQLLVATFVGGASMLALYIVGLPYWALVGLIAGVTNLIPLIGPFIGGGIAVFIAFTTDDTAAGFLMHPEPGWPLALASAIALLIVQQIDNHIISPNVVARTVKLHPVTVMLSLLAGGTLLGLWGMLLAVPTVAAVKILLLHYWDTQSSWPPRAPAVAPVPEDEAAAHREEPGPGTEVREPTGEPARAVEGATGHWWWRWNRAFRWRRRRGRAAGPGRGADGGPGRGPVGASADSGGDGESPIREREPAAPERR